MEARRARRTILIAMVAGRRVVNALQWKDVSKKLAESEVMVDMLVHLTSGGRPCASPWGGKIPLHMAPMWPIISQQVTHIWRVKVFVHQESAIMFESFIIK